MAQEFDIYRLDEDAKGIIGRVVLKHVTPSGDKADEDQYKTTLYVWRWKADSANAVPYETGKALGDLHHSVRGLLRADTKLQHAEINNLYHAQFIALWAQTGAAFRAHSKQGPSLAWASLMAVLLCTPLFLPGVYFTASIYVVVAVLSVYVACVMESTPYITTASRVATAVAVGTALLSILAWQNAEGMPDKIAAAFRVGVVLPVAFGIVSTTQWLQQETAVEG